MNEIAEKIINSINEKVPDSKREQQKLLASLLLALSPEIPIGATIDEDVRNLIWAVINHQINFNSVGINESGKQAYLLLGSEDRINDYDPPYIARIQREAKAFAELTKLPVQSVSYYGDSGGLSSELGPHHIVRLDSFLEQLKNALPKEHTALLDGCEQLIQNFNRKKIEDELNQKLHSLKEYILRDTVIELSTDVLLGLSGIVERIGYGRQEIAFKSLDNLLVISQFKWDTQCNMGGYCTPSSVTDYAVREIYVVDIQTLAIIGRDYEKNLFRTSEKGVIGSRYEIKMKSVARTEAGLTVEFIDATRRSIQLEK